MRTARASQIVILVLAWLAWAPLRAAPLTPEAEVERLADEAVRAYRAADYRRAIDLYQRAYAIRPVAALLYNLAKVHDKLGDGEAARDTYRRFLNAPDGDATLRVRAEARLAALEEARRAAEPPPPPPAPTPPVHVEPAAVASAPLSAIDKRAQARHRNRLIALGSGAATFACGVVAVGLSGSALALQHDYDRTTQLGRKTELRHDSLTQAGTADVFYIATGVGAVVTSVFVYLGFRHERPPAVALLPSLSPAGAGLVAAGRF